MHSVRNEANSNSELSDESSLHTAMFSHAYSVNHNAMAGFPLPVEALMNFSYAQMPNPHESWNVLPGRDIIKDFPNGTPFQDIQGVLPLPPAAFDHNTNYGLPFDSSTRWPVGNELVIDNPGPCRFNNELSLSLATSKPPGISIQEHHRSEMSSSGRSSSSNNSLSVTFNSSKAVPISMLLSGSKFLPAVQELLAEIACCTLENVNQITYSGAAIDPAENESVFASTRFQNKLLQEHEVEARKKHLMSLLQVVDEQYSQCVDEIHTVVSAFHAVTELDPNLHARFALPTISFMYKKLRERISRHILAMGPHLSQGETGEHNPFEASFLQKQWALQQQLRKRDHHLWKPQRGLPERSVSVLRAWMFQNFLHPYPRDAEKHLLAMKSGLTRSQVSNWFINARVRLWKPMIEEMYAEMNRRKARRSDENNGCTSMRSNQLNFENMRYTMN